MDTPERSAGESWQRLKSFARELWHDQDLWIRAIAAKGGAGIILATGVIGITHVVALPFFLAAAGLALCGGFIGVGLFGMAYGAKTVWDKLKELYCKTILGREPEKKADAPPLHERSFAQKIMRHPWARKLADSRAWKTTQALTQKQQDLLLAGFAGTGSLLWGTISAVTLVTQLLILPVVAIGGLLTVGTAVAVGGLASSVYGVFLAGRSVAKTIRLKKNTMIRKKTGKTRIAIFLMPSVQKESGLLPDDRWILATAFDILKTDKALQKSLGRVAGFTALSGVTAFAGIAGIVAVGAGMVAAASAGTVIAVATVATGIGCFCAIRASAAGMQMKRDVLPKVRSEVVVRYTKMKAAQMAEAWKNMKPKNTHVKAESAGKPRSASLASQAFGRLMKKTGMPQKNRPSASPAPSHPQ